MTLMAGHIGQRPAQGRRAVRCPGTPLVTPNPFVTGEAEQRDIAGHLLRREAFRADDGLEQAQRIGRFRAVVASLPETGWRSLPQHHCNSP